MTEPLRFSVLSAIAKSPRHALHVMQAGRVDTPQMRLGRLAHAVALGTPVGPVWEGDRRGNAWKAFKEEHVGEDIITTKEFEHACEMGTSLGAHPEAADLIKGIREETVLFTLNGRACRTTPDVRTPRRIVELKSTADASPRRFPWIATGKAYQAQMTWQKDGLIRAGLASEDLELWIVAVEVPAPFAVGVYRLTADAEDYGRRVYRAWLESFLVCEQSDDWPSYPAGILDSPAEGVELVGADGELMEID